MPLEIESDISQQSLALGNQSPIMHHYIMRCMGWWSRADYSCMALPKDIRSCLRHETHQGVSVQSLYADEILFRIRLQLHVRMHVCSSAIHLQCYINTPDPFYM